MIPRPPMVTKKNHAAFKLLLATLLVGLLAGCKPPGPKALLDGKRLLEKGRLPEAIERLEVATDLLRTNAHAWNYLGVAYHQAGQWTNAVTAYKRALLTGPDLMEARLNLGVLHLEAGRPAEARAEFVAYTLSRPHLAEGFQRLASAEMQLRELAQAELHVRKALQLDESSAAAWNTLGLIQVQRNRPRDASQSFGAALKQLPEFAPALLNLAIVQHQQLADRPAALKLYRQYVELNPRPADAESVRALIRQLESELAPARPRALAPAPVAPPVTQAVVTARPPVTNPVVPKAAPIPVAKPQPVISNPVVASAPVRSAPTMVTLPPEPTIRTAPESEGKSAPPPVQASPAPRITPVTRADAAEAKPEKRSFLQTINPANLFRSSKPAVTPLPSSEAAAEPVLQAARKATTTTEPEAQPQPAVSSPASAPSAPALGNFVRYNYRGSGNTNPGDRAAAQRFAAKGAEAMTTKRYLEAASAYRAAAEADPSWFQAHLNRSAAALQGERVVEALHAGETALALKPDSVEARYNFALALKRGNYVIDAAIELERLLAASPGQADAHLVLGNLYAEQLRQPVKARAHYLQVLELKPDHPRASAIRFWLKANPR